MKSFAVGTCVSSGTVSCGRRERSVAFAAEGTGGTTRDDRGAPDEEPDAAASRFADASRRRRLEKSLGGGGGVGISRDGRRSRAAGQRTVVIFLKLYCMLAMAASVFRAHLSRDGRARASQCPTRGAVFRAPPSDASFSLGWRERRRTRARTTSYAHLVSMIANVTIFGIWESPSSVEKMSNEKMKKRSFSPERPCDGDDDDGAD